MNMFSAKVWSAVRRKVLPNSSILLFFAIWQFFPGVGLVDKALIPVFSDVIIQIYHVFLDGGLTGNILISLQRTLSGFILAAVIMIPAGFVLGGLFPTLHRLLEPLLRLLEKVNPFALFPVFILVFGIGETSKIAMIFWVSQWPLLFYTIVGVQEIDPLLLKSARSMGASRALLFRKVIFPSALPGIFTGMKIAAQTSFFIVISAEMLGASRGLGWLTVKAQVSYQLPLLFGATLLIAVIGAIINKLFRMMESKLLVWKESAFANSGSQ